MSKSPRQRITGLGRVNVNDTLGVTLWRQVSHICDLCHEKVGPSEIVKPNQLHRPKRPAQTAVRIVPHLGQYEGLPL